MVTDMPDMLKKIIEKRLKDYRAKPVKISGKKYNLHVFYENEDLNLFEGFLFAEPEEKSELSYLISRYRAPVSGYVPRLSLLFYKDQLILKDYRKNKHIRKTLRKINKTFISKLKKALDEPTEINFDKLFDRTDIIEEFYILYKKARGYLLENVKGISEEDRRTEFVDNFMMQMLTLWFLQEKEFFNKDTSYFITKFEDLKQKKLSRGFESFYQFLAYFFERIKEGDTRYYKDTTVGEVVIVGPAIFLNTGDKSAVTIADKCFYKDGMTEVLIKTAPKKVLQDVPLFNLFESRDWVEGDIDEFVLGALYEKLMTEDVRKKTGSYYTPEEITSYICKNTIEPYFVDRVNEKFNTNFVSTDQIAESNNKEILRYLFEQLKEIKILDPAVGSAHFLENAVNVLLGIYERIWDKARDLRLKIEIIAADEHGKIKPINLLEIGDLEQLRMLVKFFIILSRNVYGVDINQSAINIAKARLFLTIARHFKAGKYFIRFPNVHSNLRDGNSLIGYVKKGEEKEEVKSERGQLLLDFFIKEKEMTYIVEVIKIVSELRGYLVDTARTLGIRGNILKEVGELNRILTKARIEWSDFEKVLRTKEKLISILIASLNSQYARPLNELLNTITELFNNKLDEKFAEEHGIKLEDLKEVKTFHWISEFPEVFLDRGGFDVVMGNPPYVRADTDDEFIIKERELILKTKFYETLYEKWDIYLSFLERGFKLLHLDGYFSLIVEDSYNSAKYTLKSHDFFIENAEIKQLEFCSDVKIFVGVGVRNTIVVFKSKTNPENTALRKKHTGTFGNFEFLSSAKQSEFGKDLFNPRKTPSKMVRIERNNLYELKDICYISKGMVLNSDEKNFKGEFEKGDLISDVYDDVHAKPYVEGKMIEPYAIKEIKFLEWNTDRVPAKVSRPTFPELYIPPKLLFGSITGGTLDNFGLACNHSIAVMVLWKDLKGVSNRSINKKAKKDVRNKYEELSKKFSLKYILLILNSKLGRFMIAENQRNKLSVYPDDLAKIKIPIPPKQDEFLCLVDYLLMVSQYLRKEENEELKAQVMFFITVSDLLLYELYFKEKFHEEGFYQEPKEYLLQGVSKHLKPINYDKWAELYWTKQLEGKLMAVDEKELEKLENENLKIIEEVYNALIKDKGVQKQIERIKGHEWVKVVEGNL